MLKKNLPNLVLLIIFIGCFWGPDAWRFVSKKFNPQPQKTELPAEVANDSVAKNLPIVGKEYEYSLSRFVQPRNPFETDKIDTVQVVAVKGDYVQWKFIMRGNFCLSDDVGFFNEHTRLLKK